MKDHVGDLIPRAEKEELFPLDNKSLDELFILSPKVKGNLAVKGVTCSEGQGT